MRVTVFGAGIAAILTAAATMAGFGGQELYVASIGQGSGAGGSEWKTTVWANNPGSGAADCEIAFLLRNQPNPNPSTHLVTIQPGETKVWDDVVPTLFGTSGYGALRFSCSGEVVVNSRIFNDPGNDPAATQGQFFSAIPATFAIGNGESTDVLGVNQDSDQAFRYNFGFVETTGSSATVTATLFDGDGTAMAARSYILQGHEPLQFNIADLGAGSEPTGNGRLHVEVVGGTGEVIVFGSGIANTSQDPSTFEMAMAADAAAPGNGDITAVYAGDGLSGGGETGDVTVEIADDGVETGMLADQAVSYQKISPQGSSSGQVLTSTGTAVDWEDPPSGSGTGDITAVNAGDGLTGGGSTGDVTLSIADLGVTTSMLAQGAVATSKLASGSVTTGKIEDAAVTAAKISIAGAQPGQVLKYVCNEVTWSDDLSGLTLPFQGETTYQDPAFWVKQYGTGTAGLFAVESASSTSNALYAYTKGSGGAIFGHNIGQNGLSYGVKGSTNSNTDGSAGVYGLCSHNSGESFGVLGESPSATEDSAGVRGKTTAASGRVFGVLGTTDSSSSNAAGVRGEGSYVGTQGVALATSGETSGVWGWAASSDGAGVWGHSNAGHGVFGRTIGDWNWRSGVYGEATMGHANGVTGWNTGSGIGVYAWSQTGTAIVAKGGGSVLMGVYDRATDDRRFRVDNNGHVYADGSFHSGGADFAELYPAAEPLEPGTVVAIGPDGRAVRATAERAHAVMGVVASMPSIVGNSPDEPGAREGHVPVAILGIVDAKVTDRSGAIRPGDLLTAGQVPGTAEKAVWAYPGTVVGKALEPFDEGEGTIRMLVTLR